MDSTDWANRFVPLPPTEFPPETSGPGRNESSPTRGDHAPESPITQANLPCLQAIAGIDPFFTPTHTSPQTPSDSASATADSSPFLPPSEPLLSHTDNSPATDASSDIVQASDNRLHCPPVEVIGQQAEQTPIPSKKHLTPQTPLREEKTEINHMKNPNQAKPIVEIHEYDLAMKVLPKVDTPVAATNTNEPAEVMPNEPGNSELLASQEQSNEVASNDIASYWSQNNVSCFIPGVTPIEAYPVCREYEEQISATRLAAANDIEPEQESQPEQACQQEAQTENASNASDSICEIAPTEEPATAETTDTDDGVSSEPLQVDPFENDEFESVYQVATTKLGNQELQTTPVPLPSAVATDKAEIAGQDMPADEGKPADISELDAIDSTNNDSDESTVEETPELATNLRAEPHPEPAAETPEPASTPLDITKSLPQLPNSNFSSTPTSSHQLFDSVEKSLNDLQSINQLEPQESFSPRVNTLGNSPTQPQPDNADPVAEPTATNLAHPKGSALDATPTTADVPASLQEPSGQPALVEQTEKIEPSVTSEPPTNTESPVVEDPVTANAPDNLVASPLVSIATPVEQATSNIESVDLTAEPPVPANDFAETATSTVEPSMHAEVEQAPIEASMHAEVEQAPFEAETTPVELQAEAPEPTPVQQATPAFEPVDLTSELPAVPTNDFAETPIPPVEPSTHAEVEQAPIEAETTPVELQTEAPEPTPVQQATPAETPVEPAPEPKVQVIEVDGNDGYDFLDLKAFDVANAIFTPGIIFLDDGKNRFQIEYRNIDQAVFADDFQVELN